MRIVATVVTSAKNEAMSNFLSGKGVGGCGDS